MSTSLNINIDSVQYKKNVIFTHNNLHLHGPGIYGFFGKNGQGKSTLLKCISGLKTFKGTISLNGGNINDSYVCWIPTEPFMYENLTINEFNNFIAKINKVKNTSNSLFNLNNDKIIRECSTGMKKKVYLNAFLQIDNYDLYIFDEPFNGLDIESNYILLDYIINLSKTKIVLISSHIIELIENILKQVFLIEDGKINEINLKDLKNVFGFKNHLYQ